MNLTATKLRAYASPAAPHGQPGLKARRIGGQAASNAAIFTSVNTRTQFGRRCGAALDLGNTHNTLQRLDDDEKGVISINTLGGIQEVSIVNEPGLYTLVLGSRKPEAKPFKRWVAHEVLPSIRRHGFYSSAAYTVRPHGDYHPEALLTCDEQRQLLELRPDWKEIFDMYMRGLNGYEMADKLQKGRSTIYRKIVRMRRCGIIPKVAVKSALGLERALQEKFSDGQ